MTASQRLAAIGFNVDVSWLAEIVLMGLPEHYDVSGCREVEDSAGREGGHRGQKGPKKSKPCKKI